MKIKIYKRLFGYLKPYKKKLSLAIFFSVIVGVIASSPVPLIQKTFDDIFVEKETHKQWRTFGKEHYDLFMMMISLLTENFCQGPY